MAERDALARAKRSADAPTPEQLTAEKLTLERRYTAKDFTALRVRAAHRAGGGYARNVLG